MYEFGGGVYTNYAILFFNYDFMNLISILHSLTDFEQLKQKGPAKNSLMASWQAEKTSIRERNMVMCDNPVMSDVTLVVAGKTNTTKEFSCHKYILCVCSSVFYAMFYGATATNENTIQIPDVNPEIFAEFLKYV